MKRNGTILLTRSDVRTLLRFDQYFEVIESTLRLHAEGDTTNLG